MNQTTRFVLDAAGVNSQIERLFFNRDEPLDSSQIAKKVGTVSEAYVEHVINCALDRRQREKANQ